MNFDFNPVTTLVPANAAMYQTGLLICGISLILVIIFGLITSITAADNGGGAGVVVIVLVFVGLIGVDVWGLQHNLTSYNTAMGNQKYVTETHDKIKSTYGISLDGAQLDELLTSGSSSPVSGSVNTYLVGTTANVVDGKRTELALYWTHGKAILVNQDRFLDAGLSGSEMPRVDRIAVATQS
jgi:hypothetical protein